MTEVAVERRPGRAGIDEAALRLFAEHGVAGTSLQMIAGSMGLTKAAIYYHYKSKEEIVLGVLAPLLEELPGILEQARSRRGRLARADAFVTAFVDLAVEQGPRLAVVIGDPYVVRVLSQQPWLLDWWAQVTELVAGPEPDQDALVAFSMFVTSLHGPPRDPLLATSGPEVLRSAMLDASRRLLRLPRRSQLGCD